MPLRRVEALILAPVAHELPKLHRVAAHAATILLPIHVATNTLLPTVALPAHARTIAVAHQVVVHQVASLRAVAHVLHRAEASHRAAVEVAVQVVAVVHVAADDKQSINI